MNFVNEEFVLKMFILKHPLKHRVLEVSQLIKDHKKGSAKRRYTVIKNFWETNDHPNPAGSIS